MIGVSKVPIGTKQTDRTSDSRPTGMRRARNVGGQWARAGGASPTRQALVKSYKLPVLHVTSIQRERGRVA